MSPHWVIPREVEGSRRSALQRTRCLVRRSRTPIRRPQLGMTDGARPPGRSDSRGPQANRVDAGVAARTGPRCAVARHHRWRLCSGGPADGDEDRSRARHEPGAGAGSAARTGGDRLRHVSPIAAPWSGTSGSAVCTKSTPCAAASKNSPLASRRRGWTATHRRCRWRSTRCGPRLGERYRCPHRPQLPLPPRHRRSERQPLLLSVWQGLHIETRTAITMMAPGLDLMAVADSHQPIVDAIASGDVEQACRVSREHQQWFERLTTEGAEGRG